MRPSQRTTPGKVERLGRTAPVRYALLGAPNAGKTTLFNRLCGLRSKTANFPGITSEARTGRMDAQVGFPAEIVDLPGTYRLDLDLPEAKTCREMIEGAHGIPRPDTLIVILDASHLAHHLPLLADAARSGLPIVVALNMIDLAEADGIEVNIAALRRELGIEAFGISARSGAGLDRFVEALARFEHHRENTSGDGGMIDPSQLPDAKDPRAMDLWIQRVSAYCVATPRGGSNSSGRDRLDAWLTRPLPGSLVFLTVMGTLFWSIFTLAALPMDLMQHIFDALGSWISNLLPPGAISNLLSQGVVGGISGTLVFLPQICLLFFLISLLEDTGYLARAAFVADRLLRRFGLSGRAFVPLLASHACAIPGIMATRLIPDRKDRLATVLAAPFMSCSARLPVYVLLTGMLFPDQPALAGLAFAACYLLGATAALATSLVFRRSLIRGYSRPLILELPSYKMPSLRNALTTTLDRAFVFLKNAGTIILAISIVMWWLSTYPYTAPPQEAMEIQARANTISASDPALASELMREAERITVRHARSNSFAGMLGRLFEPVFAPLGMDRQLTVGVLSSFLAREVFVSTMAVLTVGDEDIDIDIEDSGLLERIRNSKRDDGTPLFNVPTMWSLLVFYVLAMLCLPTLAVTRRETGSWKWPLLQLGYMTGLAWSASFVVFQSLRLWMEK